MFFSFDGIDGAGKSTQIALFRDWLTEQGHDVVTCRDPGSTSLGETIRAIVLDAAASPISRRAEMLLYMAARAQLVEEVIVPALVAGKTVISDRFLLSNIVYQGHAGGLDVEALWRVGQVATGGLLPHLTIVLDLPTEAAAWRMNRALDRMEQQGEEFRRALRQGFLEEARGSGGQIVVIDANRSIEAVQADIRATATALFRR